MLVATLVSDPDRPSLSADVLKAAAAALPAPPAPDIIDPDIAADLVFEASQNELSSVRTRLEEAVGDRPVDVVLQPLATRRKSLFVADMDSTMIGQECIDELAAYVGLKEKVSAITERAMRGELAFEPALRERVALLAGLPLDVVSDIIAQVITITPGARTLVRTMATAGVHTALVSGGFTDFTGPIAALIGFHEHHANRLGLDGNILTGTVTEPILGRAAKKATLVGLREALGLPREATLAIGDGANDLAMIEEAGLGIAYRAKPAVAEAADARLDHADLTALLYAQGYRPEAFIR
jgi:phosphoserine phosphatase